MITIRELADNNTSISSTRWSFVSIVKFDFVVILLSVIAGFVGHFMGKPIEKPLYDFILAALGVLTGILAFVKASQGFEPRHSDNSKEEEK